MLWAALSTEERHILKPWQRAQPRSWELLRDRRKLSAFSVLPLLYVLSVLDKIVLAVSVPTPMMYGDEYVYAAMAQSFAHLRPFTFQGEWAWYPPLYSLILAPAFAFGNMQWSYMMVKVVNSVLLSSLVFPAWFLSRHFFSGWQSFAVALLVVLMPSANVYPCYILAENLFIPLFLLTLFLILRTGLYGGRGWGIMCGLSIGLCYLTRLTGLLLLVVAFPVAMFMPFPHDSRISTEGSQTGSTQPSQSTKTTQRLLSEALRRVVKAWPILAGFAMVMVPWSIYAVSSFGWSIAAVTGLKTEGGGSYAAVSSDLMKLSNIQSLSSSVLLRWFLIHINYVLLATAVVPVVLCIFLALYCAQREFRTTNPGSLIMTVGTLTLVLLLALVSALHTYPSSPYFVGRYMDPILPTLLIVGFIGLNKYKMLSSNQTDRVFIVFSVVCMSIPAFSPLNLITPANAIGIIYARELGMKYGMELQTAGLLIVALGLMLLVRSRRLKWKHSFMVLVLFLSVFFSATCQPAYRINVWSSHYSEHELYISRWLAESGINRATILFDENSKGLDELIKVRIVYGVRFWTEDKIVARVGPTGDLSGIDYLVSSRELNFQVAYSYETNGVRYYIYIVGTEALAACSVDLRIRLLSALPPLRPS